jgi:thioredoxin 1
MTRLPVAFTRITQRKEQLAMKPIHVTDATFENEVSNSDKPVLLDFWATWCGPCRALSPVLDEIASENPERFKIAKIDVDQNPKLAASFGVRSIPTLLFVKDGKLRDQQIGAISKKEIVKRLEAIV